MPLRVALVYQQCRYSSRTTRRRTLRIRDSGAIYRFQWPRLPPLSEERHVARDWRRWRNDDIRALIFTLGKSEEGYELPHAERGHFSSSTEPYRFSPDEFLPLSASVPSPEDGYQVDGGTFIQGQGEIGSESSQADRTEDGLNAEAEAQMFGVKPAHGPQTDYMEPRDLPRDPFIILLTVFLEQLASVLPRTASSASIPQITDHVHDLDRRLSRVADELARRNGTKIKTEVEDLMTYSWILRAPTTQGAVLRLQAVSDDARRNAVPPVRCLPLSLLLVLLQRKNHTPEGIQIMLQHMWNSLEYCASDWARSGKADETGSENLVREIPHVSEIRGSIDEGSFIMLALRFLHLARENSLQSYGSVVEMLCRFYNGINFRRAKPKLQSEAKTLSLCVELSRVYNTVLAILSRKPRERPFLSSHIQENAQFVILRRMNSFKPPLQISRSGFRALTYVQLMQRQNEAEAQWARSQSKSWPPWKEDKLGINAELRDQVNHSRAKQVLDQAEAAGYASRTWGESASILSGWELDRTPTIQSRRSLPIPARGKAHMTNVDRIWSARIMATRTVDEAWFMFERYRSQVDSPTHPWVHKSIFDKLASPARATETVQHTAGEGLETEAEVFNEAQLLRPVTTLPKLDRFLADVFSRSVPIEAVFLAVILQARGVDTDVKLRALLISTIDDKQKFALLGDPSRSGSWSQAQCAAMLMKVPRGIFEPFIAMLHRVNEITAEELEKKRIIQKLKRQTQFRNFISPLIFTFPKSYAVQLIRIRKPRHTRAYRHCIEALIDTSYISPNGYRERQKSAIEAWTAAWQIHEFMEHVDVPMDLETWWLLCRAFEKRLLSELVLFRKWRWIKASESRRSLDPPPELELIFKQASDLLRRFVMLVEASSAKGTMAANKANGGKSQHHKYKTQDLETDERHRGRLFEVMDKYEAMQVGDSITQVPKLLEVPLPHQVHQLIRMLGIVEDWDGLRTIFRIMSQHWPAVSVQYKHKRNGLRMWRRCIVAARAFLDGRGLVADNFESRRYQLARHSSTTCKYDNEFTGPLEAEAAEEHHDSTLADAYKVIRSMVEDQSHDEVNSWGGWPTEDELNTYLLLDRRPQLERNKRF